MSFDPHLKICLLERICFSVNIAFAIQHIVGQRFKILLVVYVVLVILLIFVHHAYRHTQTAHDLRIEFIGIDVHVLFLHVEIAPDDILCLENTASVRHGILCHIQCGQVIAVHHQNDILIVIAESIRQFLHEQIHLIDLIGIVFVRPPLFLGLVLRHCDRRIFDDLLVGYLPCPCTE